MQTIAEQLRQAAEDEDFQASSSRLAANGSLLAWVWKRSDPSWPSWRRGQRLISVFPARSYIFVETFHGRGYEDQLVRSIRRKPIQQTIWMLNRVTNGTRDPDLRRDYVAELELAGSGPGVDPSLKHQIDHFLQRLRA
jgi:hypothetical protein